MLSTGIKQTELQIILLVGVFEPSRPQRIISGLSVTFVKIYTVERTDKAEMRPEEQSEEVESCWENLWNEIPFERTIKTETDTRTE